MNIAPVNNINFGKKPVLDCVVKTKDNKKFDATLYKLDYKNPYDREEVRSNDFLEDFRTDFLPLRKDVSGYNFYVLENNENNEIVSCAETSRHIKRYLSPEDGTYTRINNVGENKKYIDPFFTILGQIIKEGIDHYDKGVKISDFYCDRKDMKKYKFSKKENESEWNLPERRFQEALTKVELRNQINFYG